MPDEINKELNRLINERILILDGAMGSMLQKLSGTYESDKPGLTGQKSSSENGIKGCCDVLCLNKPELITQVHEMYLEAGADIISTCSFNANAVSLSDYGLKEKAYEISRAAGILARKAADKFSTAERKRFAAGSMGPTSKSASICQNINDPGKRNITWDELEAAYYDNARGLLDGGVDLLLLETIFDTLNAKAAIAAVIRLREERNSAIPLMISATIDNEGGRLLSGQSLEAFVVSVSHADPVSLGLNCSFGAEKILPYLSSLSAFCPFPVSCYPNAGFPDRFGSYSEGPAETARYMKQIFEQNLVNFAGGCCGTTPEHIASIAALAKNYPPRPLRDKPKQNFLSGMEVFPLPDAMEQITIAGDINFLKNSNPEDAVGILSDLAEASAASLIKFHLEELPGGKEKVVRFLNMALFEPAIARVPIVLESSSLEMLEAALKCIQGKSLVNLHLQEGEGDSRRSAALIRRYGAELAAKPKK